MTDPFEDMTPAEAYRSGYLAGKERGHSDDWKDFVENVEADTRRVLNLAWAQPWNVRR